MNYLLQEQADLQVAAEQVLADTPLLGLLKNLGQPTQTGSSVTGLMVYPDIDFAIHTKEPNFQAAVKLVAEVVKDLKASAVKIADFAADDAETASYYLGFDFMHDGRKWHIDATVSEPGPITTNPPELADWLKAMTEDERLTLLKLKKELIDAQRYVGARSKPPYTFRSTHLYEAVLKGKARTISEAEQYFRQNS